MKHIKAFLIVLLFFTVSCNNIGGQDSTSKIQGIQSLNTNEIQKLADTILISKGFQVKITKILPLIDSIQVVITEIPYREYPSILLIKKDSKSGHWIRTFECLSPGIQDTVSGLLDWHTKGSGVDFEVDDDSVYSFHDKIVTSLLQSVINKSGTVLIPYQNFIHMNTSDSVEGRSCAPYTIDKTQYYDFANVLMNNKYKSYSSKDCMMFDTPKIIDCKFFKESNHYKIITYTSNNQIWTYTFDGIDRDFRYLVNKKIEVKTKT